MRLAAKLSALLAGATVVPLVLVTAITQPANRAALRGQLDALYQTDAKSLSSEVNLHVYRKARAIQSFVKAVPLNDLQPDERLKALELLYRSTENASVVALYERSGKPVVNPLWQTADPEQKKVGFSEPTTRGGVALYNKNLPLGPAAVRAIVMGPPYVVADPDGQPMPHVVIAMPVAGDEGETWVLAVDVSLRPLVRRFAESTIGKTGHAVLLDQDLAIVIHPDPVVMADRKSYRQHPLLTGKGDLDAWMGASAPVEKLEWTVLVEQASSEALAVIDQRFRDSLLFAAAALVAAVALGFLAVRVVTGPLKRLEAAAASLAAGQLGAKVEVRGSDEVAQLSSSFNRMSEGLQERERLRTTFSRYVSDAVATRILREASDLDLKGELVEVTVLFLDVRHFSHLADLYPPQMVVELLNAYFERIVRVITEHEGVINKFIGDAIMTVFGVPKEIPEPELRAVQTALEIQRIVRELNRERSERALETLEFGIGVNTGAAIAGNIGSKERLEYTVVGDAVNVAQRLQAMAGAGEVHISTATYARLKGRFEVEHRGEVKVKGRERPVDIYKVVAARGSTSGTFRRTS
ncbi:MAG TPA: adenylate/guanylate cyclase domain-containing protein [Myxococcaceae bacterium]|nr:adenylate/guanylate cyclase domain-containing protein [Myxococcaceae bacterium]